MRVLALDTTTRAGSVAVVHDGRLIAERAGDSSRSHAERLPGEIVDLLAACGCTSADVDLLAVASGPGSFTGLRIGIATMQGLALVHGIRVAPISALRALAEVSAAGWPEGTRVAGWMDAHRRDVFSALYEVSAPAATGTATLIELEPPSVGAPEITIARWSALGQRPRAIAGDGAVLYAALLAPDVQVVAPPLLASTIARLAITAAEAGDTVTPDAVQPLYVRRPDAEVARDAGRILR
jgi:tRNA threonylcarbamoyladenosine biosynthesis protein TsaB